MNYPRTLVGATIRFTVKATEYDSDDTDSTAILLKNVSSHTNAAAGESLITIDPDDTQDTTPGTYFYDLKVEEADGSVYKIDEGKFILGGSPTNRLT